MTKTAAHSADRPRSATDVRLRPRARRARAQSQERRSRHSARRPGRLHRRLRLGQIVAGLRHALRRGAAALPRIRLALRPAAVPSDGRARGRRDRRPAAGRGPAAAARLADHPFVGRQRHDASNLLRMLYSRAGDLSAGPAASSTPRRSRPIRPKGPARVPWPGPHLRSHRAVDGAGRLADASASGRSPPGRPPGTGRTCATSWSRSATTSIVPWRELPKKDRDWILFTDEQPIVPGLRRLRRRTKCGAALKRKEEPSYQGTFTSARRYVLHTFATTQSPLMKKRVSQYMVSSRMPALPRQAAAARSRCR